MVKEGKEIFQVSWLQINGFFKARGNGIFFLSFRPKKICRSYKAGDDPGGGGLFLMPRKVFFLSVINFLFPAYL